MLALPADYAGTVADDLRGFLTGLPRFAKRCGVGTARRDLSAAPSIRVAPFPCQHHGGLSRDIGQPLRDRGERRCSSDTAWRCRQECRCSITQVSAVSNQISDITFTTHSPSTSSTNLVAISG